MSKGLFRVIGRPDGKPISKNISLLKEALIDMGFEKGKKEDWKINGYTISIDPLLGKDVPNKKFPFKDSVYYLILSMDSGDLNDKQLLNELTNIYKRKELWSSVKYLEN